MMGFYPDLETLTLEELIFQFQSNSPDGEEFAASYYAEVAQFISQQGEPGIQFLLQAIEQVDTERLRAIIYALSSNPLTPVQFKSQLLKYLHDHRPFIVAEAIDGLSRQNVKSSLDEVLALQNHASPYIRGSVLRFMKHLDPGRSFPVLIQALEDSDFIVRENAADELGELGNIQAIPSLRPLLEDPHVDVRQAAQTAIEALDSISARASIL
jgi:HEAT repeat protein